jgi:hypothetical protein
MPEFNICKETKNNNKLNESCTVELNAIFMALLQQDP